MCHVLRFVRRCHVCGSQRFLNSTKKEKTLSKAKTLRHFSHSQVLLGDKLSNRQWTLSSLLEGKFNAAAGTSIDHLSLLIKMFLSTTSKVLQMWRSIHPCQYKHSTRCCLQPWQEHVQLYTAESNLYWTKQNITVNRTSCAETILFKTLQMKCHFKMDHSQWDQKSSYFGFSTAASSLKIFRDTTRG